ncbi:hypothetical protein Hanom_Chr01g00088951 [Helianthus anomalus]
MNGPFVFWKRVLNFCWIKFPCTESNIQVTVDRFEFSLLSYLFLHNTKKKKKRNNRFTILIKQYVKWVKQSMSNAKHI